VDQQFLCRFCESSDTAKLFSTEDIFGDQWNIRQCNSCKAYFLAPFPATEQLKRAYDAAYYGKGDQKFIFSVEQFIDFFRKQKAKRIAARIPQKAKVLDIGCGNGRFLKHLSSYGNYELYGTEIEGGSAERASQIKEIILKKGYLNSSDFPEGFFDAITLFHVFEHLEKPKEMLEIIEKILKKNGVLVMTFPNIKSWQAKMFRGKWYHLDPPRHLVFFEPQDLIEMMSDMGFTVIEKKYLSFEQNPYGWVQSILNAMGRKREFLYEWLKGNKNYATKNGMIRYIFSLLFFIVTFPVFALFDLLESALNKSATVRLEFRKK
jgi:2-polyprenyl-3-methyl-5-hydroxy-6-metoxy-1,4-benzoquinol methylase